MSESDKSTQQQKDEIEVKQLQHGLTRDEFDLQQWKDRSPIELQITKIQVISDKALCYRRNIETLTALRKSFTENNKNEGLSTAVDKKLLAFVNALRLFPEDVVEEGQETE